ncbi:hypothetical protein CLU79DRAFT_211127 [Phycomyces nitens]|nr:hypothetical protein CLU79DRAFT_211127 [Phycomyces nitens]
MTLPKPRTFGPSTPDNIRRQRSGSISSENSLNSQSTITAGHMYGRYVGTPPSSLHPSESSSSSPSSRSHSRLSSYSTSNQGSSSALPRARTASNNMLQQSRSFTTQAPSSGNTSVPGPSSAGTGTSAGSDKIVRSASRIGSSIATSKLAKRASHIPSPASTRATIIPQRTKSTHPGILHDTPSARNSRASHIPSARATVYRLTTPDPARAGSRLGVRSTTPGPRNSLFGTPPASSNSGIPARPQTSLSTGRPSGLQTPSRVMSRIAKKT